MSDPRTPSRAERARLRALAEQAVAGPWVATDTGTVYYLSDRLAQVYGGSWQQQTRNALYIAACSPSVVLSLLAALDEGEREREIVMDEAFVTGRIYAAMGEKETPAEIHAKLRENCTKAVAREYASQPEEPVDA